MALGERWRVTVGGHRDGTAGASVWSSECDKGGNRVTVGGDVTWAEGTARGHTREVSVTFIPAHSVVRNKNYSISHNTPEKMA